MENSTVCRVELEDLAGLGYVAPEVTISPLQGVWLAAAPRSSPGLETRSAHGRCPARSR